MSKGPADYTAAELAVPEIKSEALALYRQKTNAANTAIKKALSDLDNNINALMVMNLADPADLSAGASLINGAASAELKALMQAEMQETFSTYTSVDAKVQAFVTQFAPAEAE